MCEDVRCLTIDVFDEIVRERKQREKKEERMHPYLH